MAYPRPDETPLEWAAAQLGPNALRPPDRSPLSLDEDTRILYERAVADPSSLTDEDRRKILHRPPQEEEDARCRDACGLTFSELVTKAVEHSESLTSKESTLVFRGVTAGLRLNHRLRLSEAEKDLSHKAEAAAKTEDEVIAQKNALAAEQRWRAPHSAALEALSDQDMQLVKRALHVPWQQHVIESGDVNREKAVCGLVLFHPSAVDWSAYKEKIETGVLHGFSLHRSLVKAPIQAGFTLFEVEYDDSNSLKTKFAAMRDADEIPTGLRRDAFLYIDDEALSSLDTRRPFIWMSEPQDPAEPLKVDIKHISPMLIARLTQRDLSTEKDRKWPFKQTSELDALHKAAGRSRLPTGGRDGIWPPDSVYN